MFSGIKKSMADRLLTPQLAMIIISLSVVEAAGEDSDESAMRLGALAVLSPVFPALSEKELEALLGTAVDMAEMLGDDAVAKAAEVLPAPLRETAFAFACDVAFADAIVTSEEEATVEGLAEALGIDKRIAKKIVEVTEIRNRGLEE